MRLPGEPTKIGLKVNTRQNVSSFNLNLIVIVQHEDSGAVFLLASEQRNKTCQRNRPEVAAVCLNYNVN